MKTRSNQTPPLKTKYPPLYSPKPPKPQTLQSTTSNAKISTEPGQKGARTSSKDKHGSVPDLLRKRRKKKN